MGSFVKMNQTKSIWLPLMVLVLLVHIFSHGLVMLHYKLNKKFITEKFCENKAKPKMQCNGKCHIKKTLRELTGSSKEKSSQSVLEFSQYIISQLFQPLSAVFPEIAISYPQVILQTECLGNLSDIFHPPLA